MGSNDVEVLMVENAQRQNVQIPVERPGDIGVPWFQERFLHILTPITITALLVTLVLVFSFKGEVILDTLLTIV